ncbi:MAG: sugar ABC transporter permease [Clostridia bacterium]|nr:sugar ABC transporter permease [Clostridia bacterium]
MKKHEKVLFQRYKSLYLFLIPAVVLALVFSYLPMVGLLMGFKGEMLIGRYGPIEAFLRADWTFEHFIKIFSDPTIGKYILNTLYISILKIVILFPLPVFLAVLIADVRNKGFSTFVQSMVFLPHFLSWVVITGIFKDLLAVDGPINSLFGIDVYWFGEPAIFPWLVVALNGWKEIGYSSIVYVAAILSIDVSLYEAARMDGASKTRQAFSITIPMIASTIITMLIIRLGYLMEAGFEQVYTMITPYTYDSGQIIGTYVYEISLGEMGGQYGLSTAVGLFNGIISLIMIVSANYISKKVAQEGIW